MNVVFYTFSKRKNSTARPSGGTQISVEIKEGCGVLRPSITLKYAGTVSNPAGWNYAYIADFNRYYWVDDWYYINRQWTASLRCDVLASYKAQIGASSQYITRSAAAFNGDIADGLYPAKATPTRVNNSFAFWSVPSSVTASAFVVTTMGRQGWQVSYLLSGTQYAYLAHEIFGTLLDNGYDFGDFTVDTIKALFAPEDNIVNVQWLPIPYADISSAGSAVNSVTIGCYEVTMNARELTFSETTTISASVPLTAHPDAAIRGVYLNGNSYTERALYVPAVGSFSLDNDKLIGASSLTVSMVVNIASGSGTMSVYAFAGGTSRHLLTVDTKISVDFGYGTTRIDGLGMISSVLGAVGSAANDSAIGTIDGIIDAVKAAMPRTTIINNSGSPGAYQTGLKIDETFYRPVADDNADRGRPLCEVRQISTLSGYNVCADATLALPATAEELAEVLSYLNGGFFYE